MDIYIGPSCDKKNAIIIEKRLLQIGNQNMINSNFNKLPLVLHKDYEQ